MNPATQLKVVRYRYPSKKFGIVDRDLHPGFKFRCLRGGRGGGKSWVMAQQVVKHMREHNVFVLAGREIQKSIRDSSKKLLADTIHRLGLEDEFEILRDEIRHRVTGATCVFMGFHANPRAIKSLESCAILWLEEADQISLESWRIIIPTMRVPGWMILISYNPDLPTTPVEIVLEEEKHRAIVATVTYLDNPWLDPSKVSEAELMKTQDPERYAHEYLGHFKSQANNSVVPLKAIMAAQQRRSDALDTVPIIGSLDVAHMGSDDNAFVVRQGWHILYIETWNKWRDADTTNHAVDLAIEWNCACLVVDVGGGPAVAQLVEDTKLIKEVIQFNGAHAAPSEFLNKRAQCWFAMKDWLLDQGCLPPKERRLAEELMTQTYKMTTANRKQLTGKDEMVKSPDIADALSMSFDPAAGMVSSKPVDLSKFVRRPRLYSRGLV